MRSTSILLLSSLLIGSWATPGAAEIELKPGMKFENFIKPGNQPTQIALPEGAWEVASVSRSVNNNNTPILQAILYQQKDSRLSKAIWFAVSLESDEWGYVPGKNCDRKDMHYVNSISNSSGGDQDCRWLNHHRTTLSGSKRKLNNDAGMWLQQKNITVPHHLITSGYRLADVFTLLRVRYYVNPEIDGFDTYPRTTWADSPWHPASVVSSGPRKIAYIDKLKKWTDEWYQTVKAGFAGKLTGAPIASPTPAATATEKTIPSEDVAGRLKKLDALLKQELISKDEYERKRKEILKDL